MLKHRETHPTYVEGCFGCKAASVGLRPSDPGLKHTVDHTDTAVVTTTEHFSVDRQDVVVKLNGPVVMQHTQESGWTQKGTQN